MLFDNCALRNMLIKINLYKEIKSIAVNKSTFYRKNRINFAKNIKLSDLKQKKF